MAGLLIMSCSDQNETLIDIDVLEDEIVTLDLSKDIGVEELNDVLDASSSRGFTVPHAEALDKHDDISLFATAFVNDARANGLYLENRYERAKLNIRKTGLDWGNLSLEGEAFNCYKGGHNEVDIRIIRPTYNTKGKWDRVTLMYHEMAHAVLGLTHVDIPLELMNPYPTKELGDEKITKNAIMRMFRHYLEDKENRDNYRWVTRDHDCVIQREHKLTSLAVWKYPWSNTPAIHFRHGGRAPSGKTMYRVKNSKYPEWSDLISIDGLRRYKSSWKWNAKYIYLHDDNIVYGEVNEIILVTDFSGDGYPDRASQIISHRFKNK